MSRSIRLCIALALLTCSTLVSADTARPTEQDGICLGPWECMQICYDQGCLTTTGCDTANNSCFCANCTL